MNRHNTLVQELALAEYIGLSDQERYDSLVLEDIPDKTIISTHDIQMYLESVNKLYLIRSNASDSAKHVVMVFDEFDYFDMSDITQNSVLTAVLSTITNAGIISQGNMDIILSYGDILISRASELLITDLRFGEVIDARTT